MAVIYAPDSNYAKEMVKHEAQYSPFGPGLRPHVFRLYPMMMHRAGRPASGLGLDEIVDTCIVTSDMEVERESAKGFRPTPLEALEHFRLQQFEIAELAAERNFHERRMSPQAQAEAEAANADAGGHLASVPETPIKPKKAREA